MTNGVRFGLDAGARNLVDLSLPDVQLSLGEALCLYTIVHANRPRHVLEIGTCYGGSSRIIAQAMIDTGVAPTPATYFMIDPMPRHTPENDAFLRDKGTVVAAASPQALDLVPWVPGGFDFVFVDGDHAEQAVYRDLEGLRRRISRDAFVLCHDVFYVPTGRGVERAAKQFGYRDCGLIASVPNATDQMEDDYQVVWGGLRLLRGT